MTQRGFASRLFATKSAVSKWERGGSHRSRYRAIYDNTHAYTRLASKKPDIISAFMAANDVRYIFRLPSA